VLADVARWAQSGCVSRQCRMAAARRTLAVLAGQDGWNRTISGHRQRDSLLAGHSPRTLPIHDPQPAANCIGRSRYCTFNNAASSAVADSQISDSRFRIRFIVLNYEILHLFFSACLLSDFRWRFYFKLDCFLIMAFIGWHCLTVFCFIVNKHNIRYITENIGVNYHHYRPHKYWTWWARILKIMHKICVQCVC